MSDDQVEILCDESLEVDPLDELFLRFMWLREQQLIDEVCNGTPQPVPDHVVEAKKPS